MAQLALGVVGAVVGTVIGGPGLGTSIGFAIGSFAGGVIERATAKPIEGPRLQDLGITTATYGLVIPEFIGHVRLPANIVWAPNLVERKKKRGGKGSTSGKGPAQNTYTYTATFRASFGKGGEGQRLLRLWLDNKLAFDCTGSGEAIGAPGVIFRVHDGRETQLPDPAEIAQLGDDAPAYRGLFSVVFDRLDLTYFGNRRPSVMAEIATVDAGADVTTTTTNLSVGNGNPFSAPALASTSTVVDWGRRIALRGLGQSGTLGIGVQDIGTGLELRVKTIDEMHFGTTFVVNTASPSVVGVAQGGAGYYAGLNNSTCLTRFDPLTLQVTGQHAYTASGVPNDYYDRLLGAQNITCTRILCEGSPRTLVLYTSLFGTPRIIDGDLMESIWGMSDPTSGAPTITDAPDFPFHYDLIDNNVHMCGGEQRLDETDVWLLTSGDASATGTTDDFKPRLQRVQVGAVATFFVNLGQTMGLVYETIAILEPATIHPGATRVVVSGLQYDPSDDCLVFVSNQIAGTGVAWRMVKVDIDGNVIWSTAITTNPSIPSGHARLDGTKYAIIGGSPGQMIDLRTGVAEDFSHAGGGSIFGFDGISRSFVGDYSTVTQKRVWVDRFAGGSVPLADVVSWLCENAGLAASDLDVSALTGDVRGLVRGQDSARDVLSGLGAAFAFDAVESDDVVRFVHRGGASLATIAYDDLARPDRAQPALPQTRTQEVEIPRRLVVHYRDTDKDQQSGAAHWARQQQPTPLVSSREEAVLDLSPLVLTASEAKSIARRQLTAQWAERITFDGVSLAPALLRLDAADPVTLTMADGTTQRVRLARVEVQSDFSLRLSAVAEDASLYALDATADGGLGHSDQTVPAPYLSRVLFGQSPLLADADDSNGAVLRMYLGAGGFAGQDWLGGRLFYSRDQAQWDEVAVAATPMAWGVALNVLPAAPISAFLTDRNSTLRVSMQNGAADLDTVTEEQMLNGANRALLVNGSGQAELIGFRDVTANGDGSYTLSTFLRGQRGSEWACGLHDAAGLFVLVDDALQPIGLALSDLNLTRYARFLGRFDGFDGAEILPRVISGAAEKPLAPVSIAASRDGSGNITLTWLRRTRIGGEWMDLVEDVPLGEASEAYEVDIMDGPDVARTITGLATATASYSAANQTTDFGGTQAAGTLAVRVYQISEAVGRGYAGSATV